MPGGRAPAGRRATFGRVLGAPLRSTGSGRFDRGGEVWTPEDIRRKYGVLRAHCDQLGRPFDSILRTYFNFVSLAAGGDGAASAWTQSSTAVGRYAVFTGAPPAELQYY